MDFYRSYDNIGFHVLSASADNFNRYSIRYSCGSPVRCVISYDTDGGRHSEEFFLEAGCGKTLSGTREGFRSFIDGYLEGVLAHGEVEVRAEYIDKESFLEIESIDFELCPVFEGVTCFIENKKYRVGVEHAWGGGLSYIADKHSPDGVENILNRHDTGRLVQQSYYGIKDAPFVQGHFMGNPWGYNPVQGGDRTDAKSKLVDMDILNDSIYVKCQPLDWGQDNWRTPSYMENCYSFVGNNIRVDNRFIDFSGWTHPMAGHEVPAFYTISYLGNFWYYGGEEPWQNDELTVKRDLFFWPEDWQKHTFILGEGNTERWCAWTDDSDWGIGLYTPDIHYIIGGRHQYDGSKSPEADSCSYVAPMYLKPMVSFEPIEYSYLMHTGELCDIRREFTQNRDFAKNFK